MYICMRRPTDNGERYLYTYLISEDTRLRLDLAPHPLSVKRTLLGNIHTTAKRAPLVFCKRVHRYTHAPPEQMKSLCKEANMLDADLIEAIDKVFNACEVCAKNGRPAPSKKVSLTQVNSAFHEEIQIDFMYTKLRGTRYTVMTLTDVGTGFTELCICSDRKMETIVKTVETVWVCQHGAPTAISSDDEYNRAPLRKYLSTNSILFKPRPARRHNKLGVVERKNGVVKAILSKLNKEHSNTDAVTLVSRAAFLSNLFSGNKILSSFELVRGYSPSVVGIPKSQVTIELLNAHKEQAATCSLQRLLHSRCPTVISKELFNPGDPICVFYGSSKQNEAVEWAKATVVSAEDHIIVARRSTRGPPMRVAYEDVRFAPRSALTAELRACSLEEALAQAPNPEESSANRDLSDEEPLQYQHLASSPNSPAPDPTQGLRNALLGTPAFECDSADLGEKDIGEYAIA